MLSLMKQRRLRAIALQRAIELSPILLLQYLKNGAFPHIFVWRNDISTAQREKLLTELQCHHFFPEGSGNIYFFFHTKGCGNAILIEMRRFHPVSINPLKNHYILKK